MAIGLVPYGKLADGKFGFRLEDGTNVPLASVLEVENILPSASDAENFPGRLVFQLSDATIYVFINVPTNQWKALQGIPAQVGAVAGNPPSSPTPQSGSLYWDTDTEVAFVWDGTAWKPIGGTYASQVVTQKYTGNGFDTIYATGSAQAITSQYVEVFFDGVRQYPNPSGVYDVIGTNVVFSVAPPTGVVIYVRTFQSTNLTQNAQIFKAQYTAAGGETDFNIGATNTDPSGVFVFVNGAVQAETVNYTVVQQNTQIVSISKVGPTTARAVTVDPHYLSVGVSVTIGGVVETSYYGLTFTVTAVPSASQFEFTVSSLAPASATGNPIIYFYPAYKSDLVRFVSPRLTGEVIDIRALKSIVVAPSNGEINTGINLGTGLGLFASKAGVNLQFKSLLAGANIGITDLGNELRIAATSGLAYEDRVGISTSTFTVTNESYVGVRNTSFAVSVSLTGITGPGESGRRVTIKDESGGAGTNHILVSVGAALIDGLSGGYNITTNYGRVTLQYDGANWFII